MIAIMDYGIGNLGSVKNAFDYLGFESHITSDINEILNADKVILPGVGAFKDAIDTFKKYGFDKVIECCGAGPAVTEAFMCVKPGGTIVLAGVSLEPISVPTVVPIMKEAKILTAIAYTEDDFDTTLKLIATKKINVTKYIDDFIKLDGAQEAFERLTSGKDAAVKIIFKP